jgi:hypothetical protein
MPNRLQWWRDRLMHDYALIGGCIMAILLAALIWFLWIAPGQALRLLDRALINRPSLVRFRANRTSSRHRRMTECDPTTDLGLANPLQNARDDPCQFDMLMFGWWRRRQKIA